MEKSHGTTIEWLVPISFALALGWLIWHAPAFILDWGPENQQLEAQYERTDIASGMPKIGAYTDIIDWLALLALPIVLIVGMFTVRRAPMEFESWRAVDRAAVFLGRVTMVLILTLWGVMLFEVFCRYVLNDGTIWANEMSLWIAGFVFLFAGLYAMQQRSHIRIVLLYDICPRWLQRIFDVVSTVLIVLFAFFLIYGGYGEAFAKFMRWELFGTAFDPPLPATVKLAVLIVIALVAIQAVVNLISDWNLAPVHHTPADDIDAEEIERIRAAVGAEGVGQLDVTRGSIQQKDRK